MKIVATIARRYAKGIFHAIWKAQIHDIQQALGIGGELHCVICLPLHFGDKTKSRNLEVDFLVVDVLTAYNLIIRWPTLHKVKAIIAPHLLQVQYRADDGSMWKLFGSQQIARECYLLSIKPLVEHQECPGAVPASLKMEKPMIEPPVTTEALTIYTITTKNQRRP
ncbi:hypothetical protein Cgig2_033200 [Carnegiea gigantea]|uniref:Uncharacterized protein n=1 Tax=Carnegiea gigantea TaxID=171969 RepID=A0A9Q1JQU0_9CARY|nr:hypothetical protein Cgig2_033200 [Carnegiea gigantea]